MNKRPKIHPELNLGNNFEIGTAESFVKSLIRNGVDLSDARETVKKNPCEDEVVRLLVTMSKLLISKISTTGPDAAYKYLCEYKNTLGRYKKINRFPSMVFGPINNETDLLLRSLAVKRKPTFWDMLEDAIEQEKQKQFPPVGLYRLESPLDGEWVDENPLTEEELEASIVL